MLYDESNAKAYSYGASNQALTKCKLLEYPQMLDKVEKAVKGQKLERRLQRRKRMTSLAIGWKYVGQCESGRSSKTPFTSKGLEGRIMSWYNEVVFYIKIYKLK